MTRRVLALGIAMVPFVQCLAVADGDPLARSAMPAAIVSAQDDSPGQKYFTDVALLNQAGKPMRLYSDLIKGRTVIIIPFFTTCTGACPVMNQNLAKIQDWLGDRLGKEAYILSISVDPATDTVPVLRAYADQYNARPGWYFLGGKRDSVGFALKKLGQFVETREDHMNLMIIGNEKTGLWKKAFGLADSESLIRVVDSVLNDKGEIPR